MHEAVEAKMNPEIREMLLSHSISLASAYYKPSEEEMLDHYMSAVDSGFFCLSEEKYLRRKVEKLEVERSYVDQLRIEIEQIKKSLKVK